MAWTRQSPAEVDALFAKQRAADPFGHRLHVALACLYCIALWGPTTISEWAIVPLAACWLIRMFSHHRIMGPLVWDWCVRLTLLFAAWLGLSVLWSEDCTRWADDIGPLRAAAVLAFLYPVLDARGRLIFVLLMGGVLGFIAQLLQAADVLPRGGTSAGQAIEDASRISGMWDPAVGGSMLVGLLGLSLGALMAVSHPLPEGGGPGEGLISSACRELQGQTNPPPSPLPLGGGVVVPLLAIAGIVMTGTRGAMLAAAALVALFAPVIVWMWMQRLLPAQRGLRIAAASVVPVAALVMVAGAAMLLPLARERIDRGVAEVRSALRAEEYRSDTGARVLMMRQAARAIAARPLHGVGAGGYQAWAITDLREESGKPRKQWPIHRHAHCWALHIGATTGIVGVLLLAGVLVRAMWSGVAGWRAWVRDGGGGAFEGASLSAACGLAGLVLVGAFDVISVNQQTSALLWTLVALCLPMRPQERAGGMEGGAS